MIIAITLEALRQRIKPGKSPDEFWGDTSLPDLRDAGLSEDLWKADLCEKDHDRYVVYVRPGEKVVTGCTKCLHRNVQNLFERGESIRFVQHLERQGVYVPPTLKKSLRYFL